MTTGGWSAKHGQTQEIICRTLIHGVPDMRHRSPERKGNQGAASPYLRGEGVSQTQRAKTEGTAISGRIVIALAELPFRPPDFYVVLKDVRF